MLYYLFVHYFLLDSEYCMSSKVCSWVWIPCLNTERNPDWLWPDTKTKMVFRGSGTIAQLVRVNNKILKRDTVGGLTQFCFKMLYTSKIIEINSYWWGSGEVVQWVRALSQLAWDLSFSLPNSFIRLDCAHPLPWHGKVGVRDTLILTVLSIAIGV